ncbi:MAG: PAS domain-containing protein [Hyphomicrobiales bacterium]|nr:PAS domain-containing protein [Hyphomicrobiales bacterium]
MAGERFAIERFAMTRWLVQENRFGRLSGRALLLVALLICAEFALVSLAMRVQQQLGELQTLISQQEKSWGDALDAIAFLANDTLPDATAAQLRSRLETFEARDQQMLVDKEEQLGEPLVRYALNMASRGGEDRIDATAIDPDVRALVRAIVASPVNPALAVTISGDPVTMVKVLSRRALRGLEKQHALVRRASDGAMQFTWASVTIGNIFLLIGVALIWRLLLRPGAVSLHNAALTLARQERHLSTMLHSIADAVIATDNDGLIVQMNPAAETLTGWSRGEALFTPLLTIFKLIDPPVDLLAPASSASHSLVRAIARRDDLQIETREGRIVPISASASPIIAENLETPSGAILVFRDISDHIALMRQNTQIDRMTILGEIASGVCHDFKNALGIISGNASIALNAPLTASQLPERLESILKASRVATSLTNLLQLYLPRTGEDRTVLRAASLVEDSVAFAKVLHRKPRTVQVHEDAQEYVYAERAFLEAVLINLILNAFDASSDETPVRIVIGSLQRDLKEFTFIRIENENGAVVDEAAKNTQARASDRARGFSLVSLFAKQSGGSFVSAANNDGAGFAMLVLPTGAQSSRAMAQPGEPANGPVAI